MVTSPFVSTKGLFYFGSMKDISVNYTIGNTSKQPKIKFLTNGIGQLRMDKYYHGQAVFLHMVTGGYYLPIKANRIIAMKCRSSFKY